MQLLMNLSQLDKFDYISDESSEPGLSEPISDGILQSRDRFIFYVRGMSPHTISKFTIQCSQNCVYILKFLLISFLQIEIITMTKSWSGSLIYLSPESFLDFDGCFLTSQFDVGEIFLRHLRRVHFWLSKLSIYLVDETFIRWSLWHNGTSRTQLFKCCSLL